MVYLIGSLRNPTIPIIANQLRAVGIEVFDDWYAAGPEADDKWREYEQARGHSYLEALGGLAAEHVFTFDRLHLDRSDAAVLVCPAGRSGHLELGYIIGQGKPGYILLPPEYAAGKITEDWKWLTGLYEGEGCLTRNGKVGTGHGMQLSITMRDEDIVRKAYQIAGVGKVNGPYIRKNPKHSDMWRWSTRKREEIHYVVRGLWENLGIRRKAQIARVFTEAGVKLDVVGKPSPHEFRFDVMYKFATDVFTAVEDLADAIRDQGQRGEDGVHVGDAAGHIRGEN